MRVRARTKVAAIAATSCATLALAAAAVGYDHTLSSTASGVWYTRGVPHDYYYLRGTLSTGNTVCVRRNTGGTAFCATTESAKSYVDNCDPANCYAYFLQNSGGTLNIAAHEEWH